MNTATLFLHGKVGEDFVVHNLLSEPTQGNPPFAEVGLLQWRV